MYNETKGLWLLPAVRLAPFFAAGLIIAYYFTAAAAAIGAAAVLALIPLLIKKNRAAVCAAGFLAGTLAMLCAVKYHCEPLEALGGSEITETVSITEVVSRSGETSVYLGRIKVNGKSTNIRLYADSSIQAGDRITARISLRKAAENKYRIINLSRGILLSGTVEEIIDISPAQNKLMCAANALRQRFISCIRRYIGGEESALALAMMFGDKSRLSIATLEAARVSGVSHYTAVSGAHFAVVCAVLMALIGAKNRFVKGAVSLAVIPLAVMFFGASASVVRSALMVAVCSSAPLFLRRAATINSLCAAFLVITAANPLAALDAGLQMSVLGVVGVCAGQRLGAYLAENLPHGMAKLAGLVRVLSVSAGAVICTSPVSIYCFGGISVIGAGVSVLIMPLFTAAMALMVLLGLTAVPIFAAPLAVVLRIMLRIILFFGKTRSAWLAADFNYAPLIAGICAAAVIAAAFFSAKTRRLLLGCFAAMSAFMLIMCLYSRETRSRAEFVSDGTSGAAVVCSGMRAAVVVCGSANRLVPELAECLRENGVFSISIVAADGLDYCGALALGELSEIVPIETIYTNAAARAVLSERCGAALPEVSANSITAGDTVIAAAQIGSGVKADIVIYSGSKRSVPENEAGLAVYCSSRQELLPENGKNAYDEDFSVPLADANNITVNERQT